MKETSKAIFLSYASQDAEAARRIGEALQGAGFEVWLDQSDLRGGEAWDASIRQQIRTCALFMPIISANTRARAEGYFRLEWKLAIDRSHQMAAERPFLVPVVIDETREEDALVPDKFREVQWMQLPAGQVAAPFVEHVSRLLSSSHEPPRSAASLGAGTISTAGTVRRKPRRSVALGAAALVALLGVGALLTFKMSVRNAPIGSVAVLPFQNGTGDPTIDYLSDGISESLINKLSGLSGLRVISRTSAFAFKDTELEPAEIGRKLGVDALVLGNLAQRGQGLAISAELVSVSDGAQLWGEKYNRQADDLLQLEGDIATTIAKTLRRRLSGEEKARLARTSTTDPEAHRLYLRGRELQLGSQQEMDKSIDFLQQAVAKAPEYALAYAGLAEVYTRQAFHRGSARTEVLGKAREAADRALELDPELAEAHSALGMIRFYFEWDWAGAESEFRRALELDPGSSAVYEEYGNFLTTMGRLDEALALSQEAARLDPLSVGPIHDIGINAMARSDYEQAAAGFRRAIDLDPNWTWGYVKLARTLAIQQKCPQALEQAEIAERKIAGGAAPLARSWLGVTYALCGDVARARQKLDELHALEAQRFVDPHLFAEIHGSLGESEEAMRLYEEAFEGRSPNMVYARTYEQFVPELAGDARYQALVARMDFPPLAD